MLLCAGMVKRNNSGVRGRDIFRRASSDGSGEQARLTQVRARFHPNLPCYVVTVLALGAGTGPANHDGTAMRVNVSAVAKNPKRGCRPRSDATKKMCLTLLLLLCHQ